MSTERAATYGELFAVREFRVLFAGFALFISGDSIKMLALSVLVYAESGSPGLAAAAYMAGWLPFVFGGVFLLSLADRLPARGLMVAGELVRLVLCLVLAYAGLPVWAMLALVLVTGLFSPVFGAARNAMLPDVLPGDAFVLGRSLLGVTSAGSQIAGLAVGGAFLAAVGPQGALAATSALAALGALLLYRGLPPRPARHAPSRVTEDPGAAGESGVPRGSGVTRGGMVRVTLRVNRRLLGDRRVRGLLVASWVPPLFLAGAEAMVVPYLGGQGRAGVVLAAAAAGMAVGEFAVGRFAAPGLRERLSLPLAVLLGVPWLGFLAEPGIAWAAVLAGVATAGLAYQLGLQRRFVDAVPEEVRGQAFGLLSTGLMTGQAVGAALIGVVGELAGPRVGIAAAGAAGILAALALARSLRPERTPAGEREDKAHPVAESVPAKAGDEGEG